VWRFVLQIPDFCFWVTVHNPVWWKVGCFQQSGWKVCSRLLSLHFLLAAEMFLYHFSKKRLKVQLRSQIPEAVSSTKSSLPSASRSQTLNVQNHTNVRIPKIETFRDVTPSRLDKDVSEKRYWLRLPSLAVQKNEPFYCGDEATTLQLPRTLLIFCSTAVTSDLAICRIQQGTG
jgi:hypothetical protein